MKNSLRCPYCEYLSDFRPDNQSRLCRKVALLWHRLVVEGRGGGGEGGEEGGLGMEWRLSWLGGGGSRHLHSPWAFC